jgi:hypothetical protein
MMPTAAIAPRIVAIGLAMLACFGCEPYRVEYRTRPAFYRQASMGEMPSREKLDDGTIIVWRERGKSELESRASSSGEDAFKPWDEQEDGTIVLRALLPEHVLSNFAECLLRERYDLLYQQMLAQPTLDAYEEQEKGQEQFAEYCTKHRKELRTVLNRMMLGLTRNEVIVENLEGGIISYRFHPSIGLQYKFKAVDIVSEMGGLKLLRVR